MAFALTALFIMETKVYGQSAVFSQYYASALYLNPALAGLEKDTYFGMNNRSQWNNLSLPFTTFQFSFIQPINRPGPHIKHVGGVGLSFLNDVAGANKEFVTQGLSIAGAYNYHLNRYGNNIIAAAFQLGVNQQRINYNGLRWSSQYSSFSGFDQSLPGEASLTNNQVFQPVVNAGLVWYYTNKQRNLSFYSTSIYNGFSVSNLVPTTGFYLHSKSDMSLLYKLHGGFTKTWSRSIDFSPNYLVQWQDKNFQINLGMYIGYSINHPRVSNKKGSTKILAGIWYRLQDAVIVTTGMSNDIWNLGFSYDSNIFSLSKTFGYGSSYEISLAYKILNKHGFKRFSSPLI